MDVIKHTMRNQPKFACLAPGQSGNVVSIWDGQVIGTSTKPIRHFVMVMYSLDKLVFPQEEARYVL